MRDEPISSKHVLDPAGNPAGGVTDGTGFSIRWQNGPIGQDGRNGAMVEEVIEAALDRLRWLNSAADGKFRHRMNSLAITKLEEAQDHLYRRTRDREARGVEGTHTP